jgi:hypothetical protein
VNLRAAQDAGRLACSQGSGAAARSSPALDYAIDGHHDAAGRSYPFRNSVGAVEGLGVPKGASKVQSIFSVANEDIDRLSPAGAVAFFRDLLWAEARRVGIGISQINISSEINIPDGGIDATVDKNVVLKTQDLMKPGRTRYQIKTGSSFEPYQKAEIREELFGKKDSRAENLGKAVRDCLDGDGTYVLVCFGKDLIDTQRDTARELLAEFFTGCGYPAAKIDVLSQNQLMGFVDIFPSLCLKVKGISGKGFYSHYGWSRLGDMTQDFQPGPDQDSFMHSLRAELEKDVAAVQIHVGGEPGIGKTRLVLEATREPNLSSLVLYSNSPDALFDSGLFTCITAQDSHVTALLVVDECDPVNRRLIRNQVASCGRRIRLVTIFNEPYQDPRRVHFLAVQPLRKEEVSTIIQSYGVPEAEANRWTEFCGGYPRLAHHVGECLRDFGGDILERSREPYVWRRFLVDAGQFGTAEEDQRHRVLAHISLFKGFGYGGPVIDEAKAIAALVEQADPQITWPRFQEIVRALRERKVLQGQSTLYITPKLLHIHHWVNWWETYGAGFDLDGFLNAIPDSLHEWFFEMFKYAAASGIAAKTVERLLAEEGPFRDAQFLKTEAGANFFLALTEANPVAALSCLNRTIGKLTKEELLEFHSGRSEIVWALERIAVWRDLFGDAARRTKCGQTMLVAFSQAFSHQRLPPSRQRRPRQESACRYCVKLCCRTRKNNVCSHLTHAIRLWRAFRSVEWDGSSTRASARGRTCGSLQHLESFLMPTEIPGRSWWDDWMN